MQPQPRRATPKRDEVDVRRHGVGGQVISKRSNDANPVAVGERAKIPLCAAAELDVARHCREDRRRPTPNWWITIARRLPRVGEGTRVELLAIRVVAVIFGIGALVLFAATEGPWAWILVRLGLLLVLALIVRRVMKKHPHMWDEAPADEAARPPGDDAV